MTCLKFSEEIDLVVSALTRASASIGAVGKSGKAAQQMGGYSYRGIDDVVNAVSPALIEQQLVIVPFDSETKTEPWAEKWHKVNIRIVFTILHSSGQWISTEMVGQALDNGDKGLAKARSFCLRELLTRMFLIPTSDDTEATNYSGGKR